MREGHDMLREERVCHPNDMGEVYVSDSDYSDYDDNSKDPAPNLQTSTISIEEKMTRHLEKQNQIRAAKQKAKQQASKATGNGKNTNYHSAEVDHTATDVDDNEESQEQDVDEDVENVPPSNLIAQYGIKISLVVEPQNREKINAEFAQSGYLAGYDLIDKIERHHVTFDMNGWITSFECALL